jgi:hypothetical protein
MENNIIFEAKVLCSKFINKVEIGKTRSKETYQDCKNLLKLIYAYENIQYVSSEEWNENDLTDNAGAIK